MLGCVALSLGLLGNLICSLNLLHDVTDALAEPTVSVTNMRNIARLGDHEAFLTLEKAGTDRDIHAL